MHVLVPVDGSECSFRALEFAAEFVTRYEGTLDVVHITDYQNEMSNEIISRAEQLLADAGIDEQPSVVTDTRMSQPKYSDQVGKDILQITEEGNYNHIVMGHHGTGRIGRAILGSAAETVIRAAEHPSTIIP